MILRQCNLLEPCQAVWRVREKGFVRLQLEVASNGSSGVGCRVEAAALGVR